MEYLKATGKSLIHQGLLTIKTYARSSRKEEERRVVKIEMYSQTTHWVIAGLLKALEDEKISVRDGVGG